MLNKKTRTSVAAIIAMFAIACATSSIGVAPTVKGKYFQARVEYSNLLVVANQYKASPTADPKVVKIFQDTDLKVQAVEKDVTDLLVAGNVSEASTKMDLFVLFVNELRAQLISRGLIKVGGN